MAISHGTPQDAVIVPLGNTGSTSNSFRISGSGLSTNTNNREFVISFEFDSLYGFGGATGNDKVTSYRSITADITGVRGQPGYTSSSDVWVDNILLSHVTEELINTRVSEVDYNQLNDNQYGTAAGGAGLAGGTLADGTSFTDVSTIGIELSGIATDGGTVNCGYLVSGLNGMYQRGFATAFYGGLQSGFECDSASTIGFKDCGAHVDGFNTTLALYSGSAILIGNSQTISSLDASGNRQPMMWVDPYDNLYVGTDGTTSATNVLLNSSVLPLTDNAFQLGGSGLRFSSVWAANGTIQTSDPTLKSSVEAIPGDRAIRLVNNIDPITFKWTEGGRKKLTRTEKRLVHARSQVSATEKITGMVDGIARETERVITEMQPLYDEHIVLDDNGEPVPLLDRDGKVILRPDGSILSKFHREPRMTAVDVEVEYFEPVAGKRTHWGWDADQVKSAFDNEGVDFGGFVLTEGGEKGLRPDQLLPVLWAALKATRAELDALRTQVEMRLKSLE